MPVTRNGKLVKKASALLVLVGLFLFPVLSMFVGGAGAATQGGVLDTTWPSALPGYVAYATVVAPDGKIWV
jgi:glycerol-3-phosphate acyltransferase PlsY